MRFLLIAMVMVGVVGCAQPQRPVNFTVPTKEDTLDRMARALAAEGLETTTIDPQLHLLYTRWQDTGFMYGQVNNRTATVVRRYMVMVNPQQDNQQVTVRMEAKRCTPGLLTWNDVDVRGQCVVMDGLVPQHQAELDQLGARLAQAARAP